MLSEEHITFIEKLNTWKYAWVHLLGIEGTMDRYAEHLEELAYIIVNGDESLLEQTADEVLEHATNFSLHEDVIEEENTYENVKEPVQ